VVAGKLGHAGAEQSFFGGAGGSLRLFWQRWPGPIVLHGKQDDRRILKSCYLDVALGVSHFRPTIYKEFTQAITGNKQNAYVNARFAKSRIEMDHVNHDEIATRGELDFGADAYASSVTVLHFTQSISPVTFLVQPPTLTKPASTILRTAAPPFESFCSFTNNVKPSMIALISSMRGTSPSRSTRCRAPL